ncbi:MAG: response regulator [Gammaproteobacteria bacterium]|nr:MAG: response regulator [Gammaproteobacteria bacterium]
MATILAVDDSRSMREMVSFTLRSADHNVVIAVDGVDALEKAKQTDADLVITDINMPRMDGIQLIQELRALTNYRFTPLLVLTTESGDEKKSQGKAAGATGWLVKPFDPDQLLAVVNRVLD